MQGTASVRAPRALPASEQEEAASLLRTLPPDIAGEGADAFEDSPLAGLCDAALVAAVAKAISVPKVSADTSFLTHAPLELLARAALLPLVAPQARGEARRRIAAIASVYARAGEEVEGPEIAFAGESQAIAAARAALEDGDADTFDGALVFLAPRLSLKELRTAFFEPIAPHLGAAGHAPILFAEFARIEGRIDGAGALLRAPARGIARLAEGKLRWHETATADPFDADAPRELMRRLSVAPSLCSPSPFIAPTMMAVEAAGFAARVLGDVTANLRAGDAMKALARIAALSMLQDDPASAPYGWTHALTMPLAVLQNAGVARDERALVRIAATHALGFRATMGEVALDLDHAPAKPKSPAIFDVAPGEAAGAAFHAAPHARARLWSALATRTATMEDAHLAKYTLACMDAAGADPQCAPLYLSAAAYLGAWWDAYPEAAFEG